MTTIKRNCQIVMLPSDDKVKALLHNLAGEMYKRGIIFNPESTEKWIEKNLQ